MRVVAIGDIGVVDDVIHLGDEAMFDELVVQLRRRGVTRITALSSNPADSAGRYGVDAIERIGFDFRGDDARSRMDDRRDRVRAAAAGDTGSLDATDSAWAVIDAVRGSDAVVIAGGGNMASNWPLHIYERVALGDLARLFDRPLVVSGQTLGPWLDEADSALVAGLLAGAALVGVREPASHAVALGLGVAPARLRATIDDASFLGSDPLTPSESGASTSANLVDGYCLVSLSMHLAGHPRERFVDATARLLDSIAETSGLDVRFLPHFGSTISGRVIGDSVLHADVMAAMRTQAIELTPTTAPAAAALARSADLVVTSRYHPAVFAVAAGVPTIAIPVDDYTSVKLAGALGNFGQAGLLPVTGLLDGRGTALAGELWRQRASIRASGAQRSVAARAESVAWWDDVAAALAGARDAQPSSLP